MIDSSMQSQESVVQLNILQQMASYLIWPLTMTASMFSTLIMIRGGLSELIVAAVVAIITLVISTAMEFWIPFRQDWKGNHKSIRLDLIHIPLTELTSQGIFRFIIFGLSILLGLEITRPTATGFWYLSGIGQLPLIVQFGIGMLILDFGLYWQHRIFHTNRYCWLGHQIHHSPRQLTATTGIRNHVIGPLTTAMISLLFGALGPTDEVFVMLHVWIIAKGWLQHSNANIQTPILDYLFPTPKVHRWHHSYEESEFNCNFGLMCTFWDHVPWHKVPFVGRFCTFQKSTFYLPKDKDSPNRIGLQNSWMNDGSILDNWWMQFWQPIQECRQILVEETKTWGNSLLQKGMTILGWPILITTSISMAYLLQNRGLSLGLISIGVTVWAFIGVYILQINNPLRIEWKGTHKQTQLDLHHIFLSEGVSHALITSLAGWIGLTYGMNLWSGLELDTLFLPVQFLLAMLIIDLALYWQHRCLHEIPLLWKMHRIHHAIRTLGPTRTGRHHPISPILTTIIWMTVTGLGLPPLIFVMCQAFAVSNGLLQHSNSHIRLGKLERVFASPTFHRWHHSIQADENNRNFGPNLSVWDQVPWHKLPLLRRVLRFQYTTFQKGDDVGPDAIGLEESCLLERNNVFQNWWYQVTEPLSYWKNPLLQYMSWPVIVIGSIAGAYYGVTSGLLPIMMVVIITLSVIGLSILLEYSIPYKSDWMANSTERNTDFIHVIFSAALPNALFQLLMLGVGVYSGFVLNEWIQGAGLWTLLGLDSLNIVVQFCIALIALDLCMYWHHRLMHEIPILWPIHEVHHSASNLTAARAVRNHPLGPLVTSLFFVFIGSLGMAPEVFAMAQAYLSSVGLLQHANADLRLGFLNQIVCGPKMHRWHHSVLREEHDRNFSNCLTLWDRFPWHWTPLRPLLRFKHTTFLLPQDRVDPTEIGLNNSIPEIPDSSFANWWYQFRYPFIQWSKWMKQLGNGGK